MPDRDVIGFVRSLRVSSLHTNSSMHAMPGANGLHTTSRLSMTARSASSATARVSGRSTAHLQAKILLYQQLVEGLK